MGMLEVTCVPAIMEETLIREYMVNLPTPIWVSILRLLVPRPKRKDKTQIPAAVKLLLYSSVLGVDRHKNAEEKYNSQPYKFLRQSHAFPFFLFLSHAIDVIEGLVR